MASKDDDKATKDSKAAAPADGGKGNKAGDGVDPIESPQAGKDDEPKPALVTPQAGQPTIAEDPRGDSPRQVAPAGFVTHGQAGADHPNQAVQPTRYAFEMTEWLALSEDERKKTPPPEPPEGSAPHPLAVQPQDKDDPGLNLGRKQVILK
jgi:hypothetical protein